VCEAALGAVLVVDGGEEVGLRPDLAHLEEHAFRSPQIEQEIVNESYTSCSWPERASLHRVSV
jgi:hypothetical protein